MASNSAAEGASAWWNAPYYTQDGWRPSEVPYFQAALAFMTFIYVFETYLSYRQHLKLKEKEFPGRLADAIRGLGNYSVKSKTKSAEVEAEVSTTDEHEESSTSENTSATKEDVEERTDEPNTPSKSILDATIEKFEKSRAYGLDKSWFGFVEGGYQQVESTLFFFLGYQPYVWDLSERVLNAMGFDGSNEISCAMVMMTLLMVQGTITGLPWSWYSVFVVEERHGFNKQTLMLFLMDKLKGLMLTVVIGYPVLAVLIYVIRWGGSYFYLYVWAFLFVFSIVMLTIVPVLIMPLFNKFTPLEDGTLRSRIEELASQLNFPLTKLFVVDGSKRSSHSNAYFYGFFKSKRIVLFDTLLEQATDDEIVAILGHELGHWKLWHTAQGFVIQQLHTLAMFYVFGLCMNDSELFASFGFNPKLKPVMIGLTLFSQTVWAPVGQVLSFLMTLNTRRNEFQADAFAVELGHARYLQSGLTKLAIENLSNMNPDNLYSAFHYTHPPLLERLNAIADLEKKQN